MNIKKGDVLKYKWEGMGARGGNGNIISRYKAKVFLVHEEEEIALLGDVAEGLGGRNWYTFSEIEELFEVPKQTKKVSDEFVRGKNGIGFVSSSFTTNFSNVGLTDSKVPSFKKTEREMTDAEIEKEFKPGFCTLSDVYAFLQNPPEGSKDGYANLFYIEKFVVRVYWDEFSRCWRVNAYTRDCDRWKAVRRVFSPAIEVPKEEWVPKELDELFFCLEMITGKCVVTYCAYDGSNKRNGMWETKEAALLVADQINELIKNSNKS